MNEEDFGLASRVPASLSADELDRAARFALLVLSEEHGALVREVAPPAR